MPVNRKSGFYQDESKFWELRLDVDGDFPQNKVSITRKGSIPAHWIADLLPNANATGSAWIGNIWYWNPKKEESEKAKILGKFPESLAVSWGSDASGEKVDLKFLGSQNVDILALTVNRVSDFFREVQVELDNEEDVGFLQEYNTQDHPNRPQDIPSETVNLKKAYARAGLRISFSQAANEVGNTLAGEDKKWNDNELHDAMVKKWSREDGTPWALWILGASYYHDDGTVGMMFDKGGQFGPERSGTAIFYKRLEDYYGSLTDPNKDSALRRHKFRTLVHEIGHALNLVHSNEKELGFNWCQHVRNEPEARSFMNIPYSVQGGENAFWRDFRFRFSDQELLFLRHAPDSFVSMGNYPYARDPETESGDVQGGDSIVERGNTSEGFPTVFSLTIRFNRAKPVFEFLEPVRMEIKLMNVSKEVVTVDRNVVQDQGIMDVFIARNQGPNRRLRPYVRPCREMPEEVELQPGDALFGSVLISSATNGWLISEPGRYDIMVVLRGGPISLNSLMVFDKWVAPV